MSPILKSILPFGLVLAAAVACAQSAPTAPPAKAAPAAKAADAAGSDAVVRAAVTKSIPGVTIDSIKPSPLPGFREVAIGSRIAYVSQDGKYLFQGSLVQLDTRANLTDLSEAKLRRALLSAVGNDRRIMFSPPKPKYRVTVFTDIDCGYCRKLHSQIADYNRAGISVEYLFFPRAGIGSATYLEAVNVWCSSDRRKALTEAKLDRAPPAGRCANPVADDYKLGRALNVEGTPAIYAADGSYIGGYLSPGDMAAKLDDLAAQGQPVTAK
jgi:thiol:disulfide interchange protein DsbC